MLENKASNSNPAGGELEMVKFSEKPPANFGAVFIYLAAILSIAATALLYLNSQNISKSLASKQSEKQAVIDQILSPTYVEVEKRVADFRSSITALETASKRKYTSAEFIDEFNKRVAKDAEITNLNVTVGGDIALNGETKSYRSVANQILLLKDWGVLKDVELGSVSTTIDENGAATTYFSISAKVDSSKALAAGSEANLSTLQEGGTNEEE